MSTFHPKGAFTMESKRRSIAKAISWRFFGTIGTACIVWLVSGEISLAVGVGILDTIFKIAAYFFHERIWLKIPYGKVKPPEYEI